MTETQKNPLAEDFNTISLIKFAFPSMVMMLFMGLYTIVDTIFVARFVDTNALSSINIVCPVINLIVGLGTMLATGGSAVVAKNEIELILAVGVDRRNGRDCVVLHFFAVLLR